MSVPFIPIQEISIGRCLGEGSEGIVYAGSYLETPVAIKQLSHVQEMEMNLHIGKIRGSQCLRLASRAISKSSLPGSKLEPHELVARRILCSVLCRLTR